MRVYIKVCLFVIILFVTAFYTSSLLIAEEKEQAEQKQELNRDLDIIAQQLAQVLSDKPFREWLSTEIKAARNREHILDLDNTLKRAIEHSDLKNLNESLKKLIEITAGTILKMKKLHITFASIDLYLPVKSHGEQWQGEEQLYVSFLPVDDETEIHSLTAYSVKDGKKVDLDPNNPPNIPTLVVAPEEHETHEPTVPAVIVPTCLEDDGSEPGLPRPIPKGDSDDKNSYIGIPYIWLNNTHEPWPSGDPEIYVLVGRCAKWLLQPLEDKIWLNGVNDKNKWYWLGDDPSEPLYFYFDSTYNDLTYFHFMESDGGISIKVKAQITCLSTAELDFTVFGGDDDLGKRFVDRDEISFGDDEYFKSLFPPSFWRTYISLFPGALLGYFETRSTGDVDFKVDKDH